METSKRLSELTNVYLIRKCNQEKLSYKAITQRAVLSSLVTFSNLYCFISICKGIYKILIFNKGFSLKPLKIISVWK